MKALLVVLALVVAVCVSTPLDDYVNKPDPNYKWSDTGITYKAAGCTFHVLNMTSQAWLTTADWYHVRNPGAGNLWHHYMLVVVPDVIAHPDAGFIWITGGSDGNIPNEKSEDAFVIAAVATDVGAVGAAIFQVPNQPIAFFEEKPTPKSRTEDAIIAWTWRHFFYNPNQPEWLLRLPMTKATVRAMDTLTAFRRGAGQNISKFIVAGASKRGWTTWTTAAVDKRVVAAIPVVMDELNFVENIKHHYRAYGGWSFALKDYYDLNFTLIIDEPNVQKIFDIVDPIVYSDRLTMPKLVVNAAGDEFFLPDDHRYWWKDMSDEKHILMAPNAEHSLITGIPFIIPAVQSFSAGVLQGIARPTFTWEHDDNAGTITVQITGSVKASEVSMWHAFSFTNGLRDFRLVGGYPNPSLQLVLWHETPLSEVSPGSGKYIARAPAPPTGQWTGYFVDVRFPGPKNVHGKDKPFRFTTSVGITPNTFPFPECYGAGCYGKLL